MGLLFAKQGPLVPKARCLEGPLVRSSSVSKMNVVNIKCYYLLLPRIVENAVKNPLIFISMSLGSILHLVST